MENYEVLQFVSSCGELWLYEEQKKEWTLVIKGRKPPKDIIKQVQSIKKKAFILRDT